MNSFFGIGIFELFFIAIIALIVLGPERMPGAIREVAKYFRMLRNLSSEFTSQFSEELEALDEINPQKLLRELTEDPAEQEAAKPATPARKSTAKKPTAAAATATTAKKSTTSQETEAPKKAVAEEDETAAETAGDIAGDAGDDAETVAGKIEEATDVDSGTAADQPVEVTGMAASPPTATETAEDEADVEHSILPPHLQETATTSDSAGEQNAENGSSPVPPLEKSDAAPPGSVTLNGIKGKAEDEA